MITLTSSLVIFLSGQFYFIYYTSTNNNFGIGMLFLSVFVNFAANITPTIILRDQYLISTSRKEGQGAVLELLIQEVNGDSLGVKKMCLTKSK